MKTTTYHRTVMEIEVQGEIGKMTIVKQLRTVTENPILTLILSRL